MPSFYELFKVAAMQAGITRTVWASFLVDLRRSGSQNARCWNGLSSGQMILRSWRRELRISQARGLPIVTVLARELHARGAAWFLANFHVLQCSRGQEQAWGAPSPRRPPTGRLASAQSVTSICRHYLTDNDPPLSAEDLDALKGLLKNTSPQEQQKLLALFSRSLGDRSASPTCAICLPPYRNRFNIVWAVEESDMPIHSTADNIRDLLGLTHLRSGDDIVVFTYRAVDTTAIRVPTTIEALGGWAYYAATANATQRTVNYRTGATGLAELVHTADVPPQAMKYLWIGSIQRNWDEP